MSGLEDLTEERTVSYPVNCFNYPFIGRQWRQRWLGMMLYLKSIYYIIYNITIYCNTKYPEITHRRNIQLNSFWKTPHRLLISNYNFGIFRTALLLVYVTLGIVETHKLLKTSLCIPHRHSSLLWFVSLEVKIFHLESLLGVETTCWLISLVTTRFTGYV